MLNMCHYTALGLLVPEGRPFEYIKSYAADISSLRTEKTLEYGTFQVVKLFGSNIVKGENK